MDEFTRQYLETALWAETDGETPLDENYNIDNFSPAALAKMVADCTSFQKQAGDTIVGRESRAGHDFWLTRNGHGAGFWDGDWPEHGDKLTAICTTFGNCDIYVGDDDCLHII